MASIRKTRAGLLVAALLPSLLLPAVVTAQMASDAVLKDFKINGDFMLELEGHDYEDAEIYFSERAVAYLVMTPELPSPIMINPRTQTVESVHLMKVMKKDDGTVDILADAELDTVGSFRLQDGQVAFTVDGKQAKLKPRPWLLGLHDGERLKKHSPEYAFGASQYSPDAQHLDALRRQAKDVRVRVYFGSWCPHCKRIVPRILRVADELEGSKIHFEYYGLPSPLNGDPQAVKAGIHGVPTLVVFVDGKEAARLTGQEILMPEAALHRTVDALAGGS